MVETQSNQALFNSELRERFTKLFQCFYVLLQGSGKATLTIYEVHDVMHSTLLQNDDFFVLPRLIIEDMFLMKIPDFVAAWKSLPGSDVSITTVDIIGKGPEALIFAATEDHASRGRIYIQHLLRKHLNIKTVTLTDIEPSSLH